MNGLIMTGASSEECLDLVRHHHYSKKLPSNIQTKEYSFAWRKGTGGLFGDTGEIVACAIYGFPAGGTWDRDVVELQRLVRAPELDNNLSVFVAWTLRELKVRHKIPLVISYADPNEGHHGGIYQALSFVYVGQSKETRLGFLLPDGRKLHRTSARKLVSGAKSDRDIIAVHPDWQLLRGEGKYLYARPLRFSKKKMLARFGWEELPYPKPDFPA